MPKKQYVWPLDTFPMDPTPFIFFSLARKVHTWPRRPRLAGKAIVCEISEASGGNSVFLIFQKYVIPDHFSYKKTPGEATNMQNSSRFPDAKILRYAMPVLERDDF